MLQLRTWSWLAVALVALVLPEVGRAQQSQYPPLNPVQPYYPSQDTQAAPPTQAAPEATPDTQAPAADAPTASDAPTVQPDPNSLRTEPQAPLTETGVKPSAVQPTSQQPAVASGPLLDGQPRQGPFLSGPGSFTFVMHHTVLGAMGGLFTQGFARDFNFDKGSREAMLAGTLIGAGLGFGAASWWQFNNWVDEPLGYFGMGNSLVGAMFMGGMMDLFANDVLDAVRQAGINAQEIENTIFEGAQAACCKIQLETRPPDECLERIRARTEEIIFVDLIELRA